MEQVMWPQLQSRFPFRISLVSEEVGNDFERTLIIARSLGIRDIDFGTLWGERIFRVSQTTLIKAKDLLEKHQMRVRTIAPTTFKPVLLGNVPLEDIQDEPHFREHMQLLRAQLAVARFFDAPLARVYAFRREGMAGLGNPSPRHPKGGPFPKEMQEKVAHALRLACHEAEKAQVTLALENVRSCWANSGHNTALIVERVDSTWLTVIWDPANGFVSGEQDAYPSGYEEIRSHTSHVHLKDAVIVDETSGLTRWERIGDGDVGLAGQLAALKEDGYAGRVSIETHWSPPGGDPESNTRRTYAGLMDILAGM